MSEEKNPLDVGSCYGCGKLEILYSPDLPTIALCCGMYGENRDSCEVKQPIYYGFNAEREGEYFDALREVQEEISAGRKTPVWISFELMSALISSGKSKDFLRGSK